MPSDQRQKRPLWAGRAARPGKRVDVLGDRPVSRTFAVLLLLAGAFIAGSVLGNGAGLGVTIQSTYQDNAFLDAIHPQQ